jgi:rRNA maturation protein Nop10
MNETDSIFQDIRKCEHCGVDMLPTHDGKCPACGRKVKL